MKFNNNLYYGVVLLFFTIILFSVRYIVNTNRVIISSVDEITPTEIYWGLTEEDTLLRIKDPMYLPGSFYLSEAQKDIYIDNQSFYDELYGDSIVNKGSILNLKPPYVIWKSANNDTIKVYKNSKKLNFIKHI